MLSSRRRVRDILMLHTLTRSQIGSSLLSSVNFHIPLRISRPFCLFYPSSQEKVCPITRVQVSFDAISPNTSLDAFTNYAYFKRELETLIYSS